MTQWWTARAPREKFLLMAAGLLVLLAALVQLAVVPAFAARDTARASIAQSEATLVRLERLRASGVTQVAATPDNAAQLAAAAAAEFGLNGATSANGLSFTFQAADPQQLFAWIARTETQLGLPVRSAELVAAGQGRVNAQIAFAEAPAP